MKRILTTALILIMLLAVLSGCMAPKNISGKEEKQNPSNENRFLMLNIVESVPSGNSFEYRDENPYCFYAYDSDRDIYRIIWTDFTGLNEKNKIIVEYNALKKLTYDKSPEPGAWTPRYEVAALNVKLESDAIASCLSYKNDGKYTLMLPKSKKNIELSDKQIRFVPYITDALVEFAENKITEDIAEYSDHSGFYLYIREDYLCLGVEVIKSIYPPILKKEGGKYVVSQGCGRDHEHVFFSERISSQAVSKNEKSLFGSEN